MGQNAVEPFEWSVEVDLDPTWSARHCLSSVFGTPAFHEAHTNGAHACELVDSLKPSVNRLSKKLCEFLVIEDV